MTLTHRYSFNDGTASDSVGGASWVGTHGPQAIISNNELQLGGSSGSGFVESYLQLPAGILGSPAPAAVSIEMWITTSSGSSNSNSNVLIQFGSHLTSYGSQANAGSFEFGRNAMTGGFILQSWDKMGAPGASTSSSIWIPFNGQTRMHVVLVLVNGGPGYVYLNGALAATSTGAVYLPDGSAGEINYIGCGSDSTQSPFVGTVDELRVWEGALQQSDVTAHYIAGPNGAIGE